VKNFYTINDAVKFEIYSAMGADVLSAAESKLYVSSLVPGIYMLKAYNIEGDIVAVQLFIISR
jgi:hypothetical protein